MSREQLVITAGLIFAGVSTLTLWTLAAAQSPRNRHRLSHEPPFSIPTNPEDLNTELGRKERNDHGKIAAGISSSSRPGPTPDWFIGNIRHLPKERWYDAFTAWQKLYGDIFYLTSLGRGILVVNSLDIAQELTVKREGIYSGRPHAAMVGDLMGWNWLLTGLNPSAKHTYGRSILTLSLSARNLPKYNPVIATQLPSLIQSLNDSNSQPLLSVNPLNAVHHAVAGIIIRIAYGDVVYADVGKELVELNEVTVRHLEWVGSQFWAVDYLSILRYVPGWMPGAEFKRVAREGYALQRKIRGWPCLEALAHWGRGTLGPCLFGEYFDSEHEAERYSLLRDILAVIYGAGVDTTTYTILIFLSAVLSHPHVQSKIHEELDVLLHETAPLASSTPAAGPQPTPSDRPKLPYTEAAWKEAMRWMPTLPLCIPRATLKEDMYNGWRIPRGTLVFVNAGFMCRDPRIWDQPEVYKPERWLTSHNPDAASLPSVYDIVFGFGARVCPGIQLADRIGFSLVTGILSAYDILPPAGNTTPAPDSFVYEDKFARYPANLECYFRPRDRGTSRPEPRAS